LPVF